MDEDIIDRYTKHLRVRGHRPDTIKLRVQAARTFFSGKDLLSITSDHIQDMILDLFDTKALNTVAAYVTGIKMFCEWAGYEGLMRIGIVANIRKPRIYDGKPRPITELDLARCLRDSKGQLNLAFVLAGYAGLRRTELVNLNHDDVREGGQGNYYLVVNGKGGKQRIVPASDRVLAAIELHASKNKNTLLRNPKHGGKLKPELLGSMVQHFMRTVDMKWTLHNFRHRFGTQFYQACRDIRMVQDIMGHSSPQTTAIYADYAQDQALDFLNLI